MTQSALDAALLHYQTWRHIGEYVLMFGLAGDLVVVIFLRSRERAEKIWSIIFTALILLGVGVETWNGDHGDEVIRKMRAPRALSDVQQKALAEDLRSFGPQEAVFYEVSDVDPEISGISADLSNACAAAGWKAGIESFPPTPPIWLQAPDHGILVVVSPAAPDERALSAGQRLVSMLEDDGLQARLSTAFIGRSPPLDNRIRITVYVK